MAEIATVAKAGTIRQWHQLMLKVKLGIPITLSPRTVAAILDRHGLKPAPVRGTDSTWKTFICEHMNELAATDFFTVDVWGLLGKTSHDVLFAGRSYHGS